MSWLSFGKANNIQEYTNETNTTVKVKLSNMGKESNLELLPYTTGRLNALRDCIGDVEASTTVTYVDKEYKYTFMISPNNSTDRIRIMDSEIQYNGKSRGVFTGGKGYGEHAVMQQYLYEAREAMGKLAATEQELELMRSENKKLRETYALLEKALKEKTAECSALPSKLAIEHVRLITIERETISTLNTKIQSLESELTECKASLVIANTQSDASIQAAVNIRSRYNELLKRCETFMMSVDEFSTMDVTESTDDTNSRIMGKCLECGKRCAFGFPGTTKKIYCKSHAIEGCVNLCV